MNGNKNGDHNPERDGQGRFQTGCPGGPGRPPGKVNQATVDSRQLKRLWCDHALEAVEIDGVSAPRLLHALDELFDNDKREYVRAAQRVIPREPVAVAIEDRSNPFLDERPLMAQEN